MIEIKNTFSKRGKLSLFQIFVLILGSVAIAYFIGAAERVSGADAFSWTANNGICAKIANQPAGQLLNIQDINSLSVQSVSSNFMKSLKMEDVLLNCREDPTALNKINDLSFLDGVRNGVARGDNQLFGDKSVIFDQISSRLTKSTIGSNPDNQFRNELNSFESNGVRKQFLEKIPGIKIDGKNPPDIMFYKDPNLKYGVNSIKGDGRLELLGNGENPLSLYISGLDGKKFNGQALTATISADGSTKLSNGASIGGKGKAEVSFNVENNGLIIGSKGKGVNTDLSEVVLSNVGENIQFSSGEGAILTTKQGKYEFPSGFKESAANFDAELGTKGPYDFEKINLRSEDALQLKSDRGDLLYSLERSESSEGTLKNADGLTGFYPGEFTFKSDSVIEVQHGTLTPTTGNGVSFKGDTVGVVARQGQELSSLGDFSVPENNLAFVSNLGNPSEQAQIEIIGNNVQTTLVDPLKQDLKVDTTAAGDSSKLSFSASNDDFLGVKRTGLEGVQGSGADGKSGMESLLADNQLTVDSDSPSGGTGKVRQEYENKGPGQTDQQTIVNPLGKDNNPPKDSGKSSWSNCPVLAIGLVAAIGAAAYFLLSKKKDDKKDTNKTTSNSTGNSSGSSGSSSSGTVVRTSSRGTSTTGTSSTGTSTSSGTTTPAATV